MSTRVVFWNVQHGHATYIRSPNGKNIVVDLGTGSVGSNQPDFSPLLHLKNSWGVRALHQLIITHPHRDHIDDILRIDSLRPTVFTRPKHLTPEEILAGVQRQARPKFDKYIELDQRYIGDPAGSPDDPTDMSKYGGLEMHSFVPKRCPRSNLNNHSVVSSFGFEGIKVVIPGDNEAPSFQELYESQHFQAIMRDADILLAPHHGRASGFDAEFVNLVNPRLTVISDGPFGDTSATSRYSQTSRGWQVQRRSGLSEFRKCVTTRRDGVIVAEFGFDGMNPFLSVTID